MAFRHFVLIASALILVACQDDAPAQQSAKSNADGAQSTPKQTAQQSQVKNAIQLEKTTWKTDNLNTTTFRNGDVIPEAQSNDDWYRAHQLQQPAWCYYNNDPNMGERYGRLYNWYACVDPRGLAPEGYRIPDDRDWAELSVYFAEVETAGQHLKSEYDWNDRDDGTTGNGTNESGFSALPAGMRLTEGSFHGIGHRAAFWSTTEITPTQASSPGLSYNNDKFYWNEFSKGAGFTVRVIEGK